jgi:hypothetical protein
MKLYFRLALLFILALTAGAAAAQTDKTARRDATREKLRSVLTATGPKVNIDFKQSEKNAYNFVGVLKTGLTNAESFEVVVGVSTDDTIGFRIYPHYRGGYINLDKAANGTALARQLLRLSNTNFLFWGVDETNDVFAGYTFTLESGFPDQAISVVLWSIKPLDQYIGQMRSLVDGPQSH